VSIDTSSNINSSLYETDFARRPLTVNILDNLGEVLATYGFNGDKVSMVDTNNDGVPDMLDHNSNGIPIDADLNSDGSVDTNQPLRRYSTTSYDEQGRVYQTDTYSINPTTGATEGTGTIASSIWYDHRGNQIASHTSGGVTNKMSYD